MNTGRDSASLRFPEASADGRKRAAKPAGPPKRACGLFPFRVLIRPPLYPLRPIRLRLLAPGPLPHKTAPPVSSDGCPAARIPFRVPFSGPSHHGRIRTRLPRKKDFRGGPQGTSFFFEKTCFEDVFPEYRILSPRAFKTVFPETSPFFGRKGRIILPIGKKI